MNGKNEFYISIDVETDGRIPGYNSMLQLGAAAFDGVSETPLGTFSANLELLPDATQDPDTMRWWSDQGGAYEKTRVGAREPKSAMTDFVEWVQLHAEKQRKKAVIVGYPVTYDFMFVYWYTIRFTGRSPFGFQGLDIKTLAAAMLECDYRDAAKRNFPRQWMERLPRHTHDAVQDAVEQGIIFTRMLKMLREEDPRSSSPRPNLA